MSDDTNTKYQIKVILGLLGLTGVLVVSKILGSQLVNLFAHYISPI